MRECFAPAPWSPCWSLWRLHRVLPLPYCGLCSGQRRAGLCLLVSRLGCLCMRVRCGNRLPPLRHAAANQRACARRHWQPGHAGAHSAAAAAARTAIPPVALRVDVLAGAVHAVRRPPQSGHRHRVPAPGDAVRGWVWAHFDCFHSAGWQPCGGSRTGPPQSTSVLLCLSRAAARSVLRGSAASCQSLHFAAVPVQHFGAGSVGSLLA